MGQHDLSYRSFFSHQRMVQDLLREIVGERWVACIDFDTGERLDASFVSPRHENRESDVLWKFRRKDGGDPVFVYILLLEFQSRPDLFMPVRLMGFESLLYQSLLAGQPPRDWRKLPLVIPVVVCNRGEPWNMAPDLGSLIGDLDPSAEIYRPQLRYRFVDVAAYPREDLAALNNPIGDLFRIEKSRDRLEIHASVHRLRQSIPPAEASLRRAFETWLRKVILPRFGLSQEEDLTLEELETVLAKSIDRWNREVREGEATVVLHLLRLKFGPLGPEVEERVRSADADRLLGWGERILTAESLQDVFGD